MTDSAREALELLLETAGSRREKKGDITLSLSSLEALISQALNPQAYTFEGPAPVPQLHLQIEPEYPKLKVLYSTESGQALEYKLVHTIHEEVPFMGSGKEPRTRWFTRPISELRELESEKEVSPHVP